MINLQKIQDSWAGLVGWDRLFETEIVVDSDLLNSDSGLFVQHAHPLCTLKNINSVIPFEEYSGTLSDWLRIGYQRSVSKLISTYLERKQISRAVRGIIDRKVLCSHYDNDRFTNYPAGKKLAVMRLIMIDFSSLSAMLHKISLHTSGKETTTAYLFNSDTQGYINSFSISANGVLWNDVKFSFNSELSGSETSGSWYLVFDLSTITSDVVSQNLRNFRGVKWNRDVYEPPIWDGWNNLRHFLNVDFALVDFDGSTFDYENNTPDFSAVNFTLNQNFGINVELSIACDLTNFFITQRHIFASALQKQVCADFLREIALNPAVNVNRNQLNVGRMDVLYELDGNTEAEHKTGLNNELERAIQAIEFDTRGLDPICLSCGKTGGVTYGTI